jgi:hypothetical protein
MELVAIVKLHEEKKEAVPVQMMLHKYCDVFGQMPSLLGDLKSDTPVVARQPKVKHLYGYAHQSVLSRCMVA